jgi:hypothetical protein
MIQYAWGANLSVQWTIAVIMDIGTEQAFEFRVTYELARIEEGPSWPGLWGMM